MGCVVSRSGLIGLLLVCCHVLAAETGNDDCRPVGAITPFCDFQAPEDLELTPDGNALLVSEFGGLIDPLPGRLSRFDLSTETRRVLYPLSADGSVTPQQASWGQSSCPQPGSGFAPHGIHLARRADGRWQLLAVNHGGRESIEFFELADDGQQLFWRGCVLLPDSAFVNDVVALPGGGFVATQMADRNDPELMATLLSTTAAGYLWRWQPGQPVTRLGERRYAFPNGLQISADGDTLFVNVYRAGEVHKIDRHSGDTLGVVNIPAADNSSWRADGHLLIASHTGQIDYQRGECHSVTSGFCPMAFQIVALDPQSLAMQVVFEHHGAPMGAGTAAIEHRGYLYVGSFSGNRLIKVRLAAPP